MNKTETPNNERQTPNAQWLATVALALLTYILLVVFLFLADPNADASLYAVVEPGFQFPDGYTGPLTIQDLNLLGLPTVLIYGTIGGSNTLAPGSVNGVSLADGLPDGGILNLPAGLSTLGWNTAGPRQLSVNTAGLVDGYSGLRSTDTNALMVVLDPVFFLLATNSLGQTNVGGQYVTGNSGSALTNFVTLKPFSLTSLNVSTNASIPGQDLGGPSFSMYGVPDQAPTGFTNLVNGTNWLISRQFTVSPTTNFTTYNFGGGQVTLSNVVPTFQLTRFISPPLAQLSVSGQMLVVPHGFSEVPSNMRWVLLCTNADIGYNPGDEVPVDHIGYFSSTGGGDETMLMATKADATNLTLLLPPTNPRLMVSGTNPAVYLNPTVTHWCFKVYAWY